MESRTRIHEHIDAAALELLELIKLSERSYDDGWVPASDIKRKLALNLVAVPVANAVDVGKRAGYSPHSLDCSKIVGSSSIERAAAGLSIDPAQSRVRDRDHDLPAKTLALRQVRPQ